MCLAATSKPMIMPANSSMVSANASGREKEVKKKLICTDWKFKTEKINATVKTIKQTIVTNSFIYFMNERSMGCVD